MLRPAAGRVRGSHGGAAFEEFMRMGGDTPSNYLRGVFSKTGTRSRCVYFPVPGMQSRGVYFLIPGR